jgi:hypothetical protein
MILIIVNILGIGDFNGDGLSDIMIGYNGGVQVIYGGDALGQDLNYNTLGFDRAFNITDTDFITGASAGDINGDGFDDFAVSHDDGTDINTYVVYGRDGINANLDLDNLENPDNALKINHAGVSGQNYQITELGDVNGDGFGDIQLGIKGGQQFTVHGQYSQSHSDVVTDNGTYNDGTTKDGNLNENEITATINGQSLVGDADYFYDSDKTGIRMTGGRGNNTFQIDNDDFARIQGGKGFDTISLTQGSVMLDFSNFNYEQIQGIEEIEFGATNQTITLTAENIFNILKTSDNGELRISGEGTFKIDADTATDVTGALNELGEGATYIGPTDLDSDAVNDHYHYKIGGYDLYVDQDSAINII